MPMDHADTAAAVFSQGFACSQAVVVAYASETGLDRDTALKVSAGFGGGMGRMGHTCGAVTGAYMVIGLKFGAVSGQDQDAKLRTYRLVREFMDGFAGIVRLGLRRGIPGGMDGEEAAAARVPCWGGQLPALLAARQECCVAVETK